jgi:hypothetical protein
MFVPVNLKKNESGVGTFPPKIYLSFFLKYPALEITKKWFIFQNIILATKYFLNHLLLKDLHLPGCLLNLP